MRSSPMSDTVSLVAIDIRGQAMTEDGGFRSAAITMTVVLGLVVGYPVAVYTGQIWTSHRSRPSAKLAGSVASAASMSA